MTEKLHLLQLNQIHAFYVIAFDQWYQSFKGHFVKVEACFRNLLQLKEWIRDLALTALLL